MKEKIKEFIYVNNPSLSDLENIVLNNRSTHDEPVHQAFFYSIDKFAKQVICDLHNTNGNVLFASNQLNIVSEEDVIRGMIIKQLQAQGVDNAVLNNPEMIYRAFNFVRPANLLPNFVSKLYLIKQKGISEYDVEKNYVINPYFLGFKISLDIFLTNAFCSPHYDGLEKGLVQIFSDKYGEEYKSLYENVSYVAMHAIKEGRRKNDQRDETLIAWLQEISGINDKKLFYNFMYESGMLTANAKLESLKRN